MGTNTPSADTDKTATPHPDGVEKAEERRIEVNRAGKSGPAGSGGSADAYSGDDGHASVDAAKRTSDVDRRV